MYKRLTSIFLLLVFIFTLSGCYLFGGGETEKQVPSDIKGREQVAGDQAGSAITQKDEDQLVNDEPAAKKAAEVSDAAVPTGNGESISEESGKSSDTAGSGSPMEYKPDYRIHFLSEDEVKLVNDKLVKLGYLKEPAKDAREFSDAIFRFQQEEKIEGSGDINPETFERLRSK
ncbi:MAG: peptidoglycan-binding domain-containing protein [Deltaproteobacteria bacterium]